MTLTKILRIEERFLQFQDLRAISYCERRWQEDGCSVKRWELVNFIERMLQELKANGIGYPKVLLLRKKEIQRRTFIPEESASTDTTAETCSSCQGTGWQPIRHAQSLPSYIPCICERGSVRHSQVFGGRRRAAATG